MVHAVIVRFKLRDPDAFPAFWAAIEELYAYSRTSEPDTLLYEMHRPEALEGDAARTWTLLERYTSKSALTEVHIKSPVFQRFFAWVGANSGTTPDANGVLPVLESLTMEHLDENPVVPAPAAAPDTPKASFTNKAAAPISQSSDAQGNGVLVFAGARTGTSPSYVSDAEAFGRIVGRSGRPLVYGAGTVGVMGAVASAARSVGGEVISVIPYALAPRELSGDVQTDAIIVETMSERKAVMFAKSKWTVALPGGIGTLDELFEVLTLTQLNAYKAKIGLLNTDNFYGPLLAMLEHLVAGQFLEKQTVDQIVVRSDPQELWDAMTAAPEPKAAANLVWPRAF